MCLVATVCLVTFSRLLGTLKAANTRLKAGRMLQALNIPTKINKGTVEIAADVQLIQEGNKVGASEATLLAKLGIKPFSYGLVIRQVLLSLRSLYGLLST